LLAAAVGGILLLLGLRRLVVLCPERFGSGGVLPLLPFGLERFLALLLHLHGGVAQIRQLRNEVVVPAGGGLDGVLCGQGGGLGPARGFFEVGGGRFGLVDGVLGAFAHDLRHAFCGIHALIGLVGIGADHVDQGGAVERLVEVLGREEHRHVLQLAAVAVGGHCNLGHLLLGFHKVGLGILGCRLGVLCVRTGLFQVDFCLVIGLGGLLGFDLGLLQFCTVLRELDLDRGDLLGSALFGLVRLVDVVLTGVVRLRKSVV